MHNYNILGKYVRDDVIFNTIQLVSENSELQPYVAQESWAALKASAECYSEKQPLTQVIFYKTLKYYYFLRENYIWQCDNKTPVIVSFPFYLIIGMLLVYRRIWIVTV